jgi:O-antigen/teichoic acid export membrane protein
MSIRSHALRNTLFSSIGIYIEYSLGMVAAILIARHLGPQHYGIYGLFIWFAAGGVVLTNSGVTTGVIKFVAELRGLGHEHQIVPALNRLRRVQYWHLLAVLGIGVILFVLLGGRFAANLGYVEFALLVVAVAMRAPYMFNVAIAKGFEAFDVTARITMVAAPLNLALVFTAMLLDASIFWFLVVYAVSSGLFFLVSHVHVARLLAPLTSGTSLPAELIRRMRRHLRIVSATIVIGFFIASDVEVVFLNLYDSSASAGYFKVAFQLANGIMLLVPGVFGALLLPMMAKALSQGQEIAGGRFVAATSYLVLLAAPVMAFGVCFSGPVISLLYGVSYAAAAPVFAVVIFCGGMGTATQGASSLLVSADRQHTILVLTFIFGVLKIGLDIVLIRAFGLQGAMAAVLIETAVSSTAYVVIGMRVGRVRLDWMRLLRILMAGAGAALVALPVLHLQLPAFPTLLIGGILVATVYALLTLVLGCWTDDDIEQLQELHRRFVGGRPRVLGHLLVWAGKRAQRHS